MLGTELPDIENVVRAKRPKRIPVVLTPEEALGILERLDDPDRLIAEFNYGSELQPRPLQPHLECNTSLPKRLTTPQRRTGTPKRQRG